MDDEKQEIFSLDELGERLKKLKEQAKPEVKERKSKALDVSFGFKMGTDFLAAVVVGACIGRFLDVFLKIEPFGLVIFLLIGGFGGMLNVYRYAKSREAEIEKQNKK